MPDPLETKTATHDSVAGATGTITPLSRVSNETWWVAMLTIVALLLRLSFLDGKSLWVDEGMTACRDAWPIKSLFGFILHREMNQILYYLMVHAWTSIAGVSDITLRLPSVLFGTATVPLIYALGTELVDRRTGLIGALMLMLNASAIEYAQTARGYAMLVALTIFAAVFFVRSTKYPSRRNLAGYIIGGSCAVYAHMFGIFERPAQALFLLWYRTDWNTAKRVGRSIIAVGVLSLPAFFFGIRGYHGNIAWVPELSVSSVVSLFGFFSGAFDQSAAGLSLTLSAVYLTGIALAMVRLPRQNRAARAFLLCSIVVPVGLAGLAIVISLFSLDFRGSLPDLRLALLCVAGCDGICAREIRFRTGNDSARVDSQWGGGLFLLSCALASGLARRHPIYRQPFEGG